MVLTAGGVNFSGSGPGVSLPPLPGSLWDSFQKLQGTLSVAHGFRFCFVPPHRADLDRRRRRLISSRAAGYRKSSEQKSITVYNSCAR